MAMPNILDKLLAKAPLASPFFSGIPQAPTADAGTNTQQIATTAFVTSAVAAGTSSGADKLTTPRAISLSGDATGTVNFDGSADVDIVVTVADDSHDHTMAHITDLAAAMALKADLESPALSGVPTAPTATAGTTTTQLATTAFVMGEVNALLGTADAMVFKGVVDGTHALPTTGYSAGWTYKVAEAGTFAGKVCEVGDLVIAVVDFNTTTADGDWAVVQTNIDGAVTGPTTAVANQIAVFDGTTGKVIKDSGFTILTSVPANAVFTDTVYVHPASGVTAGDYTKVTVDVNGHVTAGSNPTTLAGYGITDAAPRLVSEKEDLDRAAAVAADTNYAVPSYIVGEHRLEVFLDGLLCAQGTDPVKHTYKEVGNAGEASTSIQFLQEVPAEYDIVVRVR